MYQTNKELEDRISKTKDTLEEIRESSELLLKLRDAYVDYESINECYTLINYNFETVTSLLEKPVNNIEWLDECIAFILREYVPLKNPNALLDEKVNSLLKLTSSAYKRVLQEITPVRKLLGNKNKEKDKLKYLPIKCIITTAVPCEFRALIRRANHILKGNCDKIHYNFKKIFDMQVRSNYQYLDCIYKLSNKFVKVRVLLPQRYGSIDAIDTLYTNLYSDSEYTKTTFKEIIVCGIAGHIAVNSDLSIGDLIISSDIYDATTCKVEGVANTIRSIKFINTEPASSNLALPPEMILEIWKPNFLYEQPPNKLYQGFRKVEAGGIVSGLSVAKSKPYKRLLQQSFKDSKAIEMEGIAAFKVAKRLDKKACIIKSFCDWADDTKNKDWQPYCADVAASFTVDYIIRHYGITL